MKDIVVINSEKNLANEDLDEIEQKLGIILPEDYKNFLLKYNGGRPEKNYCDFFEGCGGSLIDDFYAYYDGDDCINLLREFSRNKDLLPKDFIAIAVDPGSNKICLGISGFSYGKIYFWEFDAAVPYGEEPTFDNMRLLANSFTDFINGLHNILDIITKPTGAEIWVYEHDRYSLAFSVEVKKYGSIVTDFFAKASADVDAYIIEEEKEKNIIASILRYDEQSKGIRFCRRINADGSFEDYQEQLA